MANVDLHVHTTHSDGSMTPGEIVEAAKLAGVGLLAVADHDLISGSLAIEPLLSAAGIRSLRAVEHTCLWHGDCVHILSYGADFHNPEFVALLRQNRAALDGMSDTLIERMITDYPQISISQYEHFERDPSLGGWKALHYFLDVGLTSQMMEGMRFYGEYDVRYQDANFTDAHQAIASIHSAGGRAVLAHPGETIPCEDLNSFAKAMNALLDLGIDGAECYYPTHAPAIEACCLSICRERGLMVTAGSDCHGSFAYPTRVGEMGIDESFIDLRGLV